MMQPNEIIIHKHTGTFLSERMNPGPLVFVLFCFVLYFCFYFFRDTVQNSIETYDIFHMVVWCVF